MPNNYTTHEVLYQNDTFRYIKTTIDLVRPLVINYPLCQTQYIGINGGFYAPQSLDNYGVAPSRGCSINWINGGYNNHLTNDEDPALGGDENGHISRGTLCIYRTSSGIEKAFVISAKSVDEIITVLPPMNFVAMIGGGNLCLRENDETWENVQAAEGFGWQHTTALCRRSAVAVKYNEHTGQTDAYLVVSTSWSTMGMMRRFCRDYLGCDQGLYLDGSGSTQMQWRDSANILHQDMGSDDDRYEYGRYIWNMVNIIDPT